MANDLVAVDAELMRLTQALRAAVAGFEKSVVEAAEKRSDYDVEYAGALLSKTDDDATQKVKEAQATLIVKDFMRAARIAEATREAYKTRVRAIETVISIQQSRLKFMAETEPSGF